MAKLDRGTRIYASIIAVVVLVFIVSALYEPPVVRNLNSQLEEDAELASFPYQFHVVAVNNGIATMHTPRSAEVPVVRVMGILYPHLAGRPADSEDFQKAQLELARIQKKAKKIVISDPGIKSVVWTLDRDWLSSRGVILPPQ